jgi:hypothetical protein
MIPPLFWFAAIKHLRSSRKGQNRNLFDIRRVVLRPFGLAVLCDRDIDAGAALSIEQFDSLIAELMVVRSTPIPRRKHAARFLCHVYKRMRKPSSHSYAAMRISR